MKGYAVEFAQPRLVEYDTDRFETLAGHLKVVTTARLDQNLARTAIRHAPALGSAGVAAAALDDCLLDAGIADEDEGQQDSDALLQEATREAAQVVASAKAQAAALIAAAEAQAAQLRQEAEAELARQREELARSVRAEVSEQARAEGHQAGLEAAQAEATRLKAEAQRLLRLAERAVQEEFAKTDEQLLHLALKIAERLVRVDLIIRPEHLLPVIRQLTLLPQERSGWLLHLSAPDADFIQGLKPEEQPPCPWVVDDTLKQGDCFLECQEGLFDARLEVQLAKLEQVLKEEIAHAGLAAPGQAGGRN